MKELNNSVVFKLRPSSNAKAKEEKPLKKMKSIANEMVNDEKESSSSVTLNIYQSKQLSALNNREYASPMAKNKSKFEEEPVIKDAKVGSRNKNDNIITKSLNLTQSVTDLFHHTFSTTNLLSAARGRPTLNDLPGLRVSLYDLYNLKK